MLGSKILSKNKRKLTKTPAIQINSSSETKILHHIPSVSQIAPLPENRSHGILPILSLDGRDSPNFIQCDDELSSNTEKANNSNNHQPVGEDKKTFKFDLHHYYKIESIYMIVTVIYSH
jgi:hypothetical protein